MVINVEVKDTKGKELNIGDTVDVYDWSIHHPRKLYRGIVQFDTEDMQLTIQPKEGYFEIDQFDLWHKAPKYKVEVEDGK